jgi:hypothetical protein
MGGGPSRLASALMAILEVSSTKPCSSPASQALLGYFRVVAYTLKTHCGRLVAKSFCADHLVSAWRFWRLGFRQINWAGLRPCTCVVRKKPHGVHCPHAGPSRRHRTHIRSNKSDVARIPGGHYRISRATWSGSTIQPLTAPRPASDVRSVTS